MAQVIRRPHLPHPTHLTLNTDGKRHPLENALAAVTAVLGVVSIVCALSESLHVVGSWTGLAGVVVGLYDQLRSATTAERIVLVIFLGVSAVGWALNMANGGFV
jgi:hypothetical protein